MRSVYASKSYFDRALRTVRMMKYRRPRIHHPWELKRNLRALFIMSVQMTKNKETRALCWRNFFCALARGLYRFEIMMTLLNIFQHFSKQSDYLLGVLNRQMAFQASLPRKVIHSSNAESAVSDKVS